MSGRARVVVVFLFAAVLLGGCGGDPSPTATYSFPPDTALVWANRTTTPVSWLGGILPPCAVVGMTQLELDALVQNAEGRGPLPPDVVDYSMVQVSLRPGATLPAAAPRLHCRERLLWRARQD